MDQIVVPGALEYVLISGVQTVAFLAVLAVAVSRLRHGAAAWSAAAAGVLGALSSGLFAVAWAQVEWRDSFDLLDRIGDGALLQHLDWAQAIAVTLLAVSYIVSHSRRSRGRPDLPR